MDALLAIVERRRLCRAKFSRTKGIVLNCHTEAEKLISQDRPLREIEVAVHKAITGMENLNKVYSDLCDIQAEIDFHPENETRLSTVKDDGEEAYMDAYLTTSAVTQQIENDLSDLKSKNKEIREESEAGESKQSFSPEQFAECMKTAMQSVNMGISGDQLAKILDTLTHKKRTVDIPKFKGDTMMFDQWKELVETELEKPGYSEVEKAHLTLSLLEGDVAKAVASLKDPTYEDIMNFLEDRYGDVQARIERAISEISGLQPITTPTVKDLDPFYNKLISNWNYLLKKTRDDRHLLRSSWIFTALVRSKLPKSLVKKWDAEKIKEEKADDEKSNFPIPFDQMLEKIKDALQVARRSEPLQSEKKEVKKEKEHKKDTRDSHPTRSTGHALAVSKPLQSQYKKSDESCIFCSQRHKSFLCPNVKSMNVNDRCEKVKDAKSCFNCLGRGHFADSCKSSNCKVCSKNHHTLLHFERSRGENTAEKRERANREDGKKEQENKRSEEVAQVKTSAGLVRAMDNKREIIMQSGVAKLESRSAITKGRVLFDTGSGVSFISSSMARKLQLKGKPVTGEFTLAGGKSMKIDTEQVKFQLSSAIPSWKGETFEIAAYVIDRPSADLNRIEVDLSRLPHLQGLQLADSYSWKKDEEVDVMLGLEESLNILQEKRVNGPRGLPVAQKSHIGWIVTGTCLTPSTTTAERHMVNNVLLKIEDERDIATKHWDIEHLGILPEERKIGLTDLESEALKQHERKTVKCGDRYETGLLKHPKWSHKILKSNKRAARNRLIGLENRLRKDPALAEQYQKEIEKLMADGYAEKVTEESEPTEHSVWYLPHHPVVRDDKTTTKVRVVFDGSMRGPEDISLNDTLLAGPALQPDLPGVLFRFRRHKVSLVADVEKMFLQVRINRVDRDCQRFLWRDLNTDKEPDVYRLTSVTFGLTSSPFSSMKTVRDHAATQREMFPKAVGEIESNMFVDDVLSGDDDVPQTMQLASDLREVLKGGGWKLRKFLSNKKEALTAIPEEDCASVHVTVGEEIGTKSLGVTYMPEEDQLRFSFVDKLEDIDHESRRTLLKQLHRVYDPMGMVSPFTVKAKQLFQRAWMTTGDWDDELPTEIEREWTRWKNEVAILDEIRVNRCLVPEQFKYPVYSLHGCGDACEASYGGAVYLRVQDSASSDVHTVLLCSKTRVSPLGKRRSIPELGLIAALVTARLVKYVERELQLPIASVTCWTDSKVVMHWISRPPYTWQTFVANRVAEIQQLVPPCNWKHVPGKINPADLCSRGVSAQSLVHSDLWWSGPSFLREEPELWPSQDNLARDEEEEEIAKSKMKLKMATTCRVQQETESGSDEALREYAEKFSSFNRLIRVMTLVRSWIKRHRAKTEGSIERESEFEISSEDRRQEKLFWLRWAQRVNYAQEIAELKVGNQVQKGSKLVHLNPMWDEKDEVIRVGGRLHYSALPEETKHPIVLPSHNALVERLVLHHHVSNLHTGPAQTLANLRNQYWLVRGKQEVRRILFSCKVCREPAKLGQKMAPLPPERTDLTSSFVNVGVDFAGPLYVKVVEDNNKKVYICLFTCMISRAIHLELVQDLSTEHFIMALKRMISRRGRCKIIFSDNAKTFKKASSIVSRLFKNTQNLREEMDRQGIEWKFITERAPWHGGFYERMVRSVKTTLKRVLGKSKLTVVEMETVLSEIEAQVNSRPLTSVSSGVEDLSPLTPGHLVIGRAPQLLPEIDRETKQTLLGRRWAYQQRLSKLFWNRWTSEYMLELNYMKKWETIQANVKIGDIVLIAEDGQRKQEWLMGRVTDVHPGRDGLVRSVTVKTTRGPRRRPVQRLRLLEGAES